MTKVVRFGSRNNKTTWVVTDTGWFGCGYWDELLTPNANGLVHWGCQRQSYNYK